MKRFLIVLLLASMAAALLLTGCGESKTEKSADDAKAILEKSQQKMGDITSVKMTGSTSMVMPEAEETDTEFGFEAVTNIAADGQQEVHLVAKGDGEEYETYAMGGYAYTYDPNTGWIKQKISGTEDAGTAVPTHDQIVEMGRYAENLRLLPEEGGSYVVAFDVSPKFYEQYTTGSTDGEAEGDISGMMADLLKGIEISIVYKINKETLYADAAIIDMSLNDMPMLGDVTASMDAAFSDYNKQVSIVLPPEAQNAKEEELLPGELNIPSVPGLGF